MKDNGPCKIEGCTNKARTKRSGLCSNHYQRMRRNGDPTVSGWTIDRPRYGGKHRERPRAITEKKCPKCLVTKPAEDYYHVERNGKMLFQSYCIPCHKAYYKAKATGLPRGRKKQPPRPCEAPGCVRDGRSRLNGEGLYLCMAHLQQLRDGKELKPIRESKRSYISDDLRRCTWCDEVKSTEAFYTRSNGKPSEVCKGCVGWTNRGLVLLRQNRDVEALQWILRAPEATKNKFLRKYATRFNEGVRSQIGTEVNA